MAVHQQRSHRYPSLLVTVKHETEERLVTEIYANSRTYRSKNNYRSAFSHPTTIYYNSNHRQKQYFTRQKPSPPTIQRHPQKYDRLHQQPIRPLMEIDNNNMTYSTCKQREPKYRNRKAELDWDHAFDLDLIDLYATDIDVDSYSLTSIISSSDNSFSSS